MSEESYFKTFDGANLYMVKNKVENPKAAVLIVHGLCEHSGRYKYLSEKLNESSVSVYAFDHRGHGKSEGKKVYYENYEEISNDVNAAVDIVKDENVETPVFVLGHSMGGYAVACFGTRYPGKVTGFIMSGALTRYNHPLAGPLPIDQPADMYIPNELGDGVCSDPAVVEAYVNDPLVEKQISISLLNTLYYGVQYLRENPKNFVDPVLLMHGCNDGLVSYKDSMEFYSDIASEDKTLIIYSKLYHEIFNEPVKDEVIKDVVAWVEDHI